ncbi:aminotransferase class V-fold PLP-dependent enzyme [Aliiglaciecola lipolytica]|uniref:cysteine desulfurase n=1 Tax=Aliiglaciecola lipolytica E3 TaxID=1127673 RepID=K6YSA6_9ALTE|nr:aminotransferase class V-fold PLP-dependent enzyme [Aliiglaciecola lipolytica]GAC14190.1 cysteine desulfurase [Aliiglaciecola lipolytica E3]
MKDTSLRHFFPFFEHHQNAEFVYFDSAATTQKPLTVLNSIRDFYLLKNVNVHRSSFSLANQTTAEFEATRSAVSEFIGSSHKDQIVFTKGATESINLIARSLEEKDFPSGGRILVSASEHHANLVPWQILAKKKNLHIDVIPIDENGIWDLDEGLKLLTQQTCILAIGMVSNAFGSIQPVQAFLQKAKAFQTISVLDAAQAVAHIPIDVQALDCDFLVFSGHKAFAPTGTGVLYGKRKMLANLPVFLTGGEMVKDVEFDRATYQLAPLKFEAGTPHIEGILALKDALMFITDNRQSILHHEKFLLDHLLQKIQQIKNVTLYGDNKNSIATVSFTVEGLNSHDVGIMLAEKGIAVRVGHHCAMPLMKRLGIAGTIRVSLSCYNTQSEIDYFIEQLQAAIEQLSQSTVQPLKVQSDVSTVATEQAKSKGELASAIKGANGWDQVFRQIMLAGKSLTRLADNKKSADAEIYGCESQVWLVCYVNQSQDLMFEVDASSKIVRGLLAVILEPIQNQSAEFVSSFDYKSYMTEIQLEKHLSETRGNGLNAVIQRIKQHAKQYL